MDKLIKIIKKLMTDRRWNNQVNFVQENNNVKPSWFGLSMLFNKKFKHSKKLILKKLDKFRMKILRNHNQLEIGRIEAGVEI